MDELLSWNDPSSGGKLRERSWRIPLGRLATAEDMAGPSLSLSRMQRPWSQALSSPSMEGASPAMPSRRSAGRSPHRRVAEWTGSLQPPAVRPRAMFRCTSM